MAGRKVDMCVKGLGLDDNFGKLLDLRFADDSLLLGDGADVFFS